jgi:hypothetical protein
MFFMIALLSIDSHYCSFTHHTNRLDTPSGEIGGKLWDESGPARSAFTRSSLARFFTALKSPGEDGFSSQRTRKVKNQRGSMAFGCLVPVFI